MSKRIYAVSVSTEPNFENLATRLVRAPNRSQAINHVAKSNILAEVASQETIVTFITAGHSIEDAGSVPVLTEETE
jgi:hypothetical protein